jgi:hypothetical protein
MSETTNTASPIRKHNRKPLSGWARLWLVLLAPFWLWTSFHAVKGEIKSWEPIFQSVENLLPEIGIIEENPAKEAERISREAESRRLYEKHLQEAKWERNIAVASQFLLSTLKIALVFGLAMTARSVLIWVWQGFKPLPRNSPDHEA